MLSGRGSPPFSTRLPGRVANARDTLNSGPFAKATVARHELLLSAGTLRAGFGRC